MDNDHQQLRAWECNLCELPEHFYDAENFRSHLSDRHPGAVRDVESFAEACMNPTPPWIVSCPLCSWAEDQRETFERADLIDHVAEHIHSFSLISLPWGLTEESHTTQEGGQMAGDLIESWRSKVPTVPGDEEAELPAPYVETLSRKDPLDVLKGLQVTLDSTFGASERPLDWERNVSNIYFNANEYFGEDAEESVISSARPESDSEDDLEDEPKTYYSGSLGSMVILPWVSPHHLQELKDLHTRYLVQRVFSTWAKYICRKHSKRAWRTFWLDRYIRRWIVAHWLACVYLSRCRRSVVLEVQERQMADEAYHSMRMNVGQKNTTLEDSSQSPDPLPWEPEPHAVKEHLMMNPVQLASKAITSAGEKPSRVSKLIDRFAKAGTKPNRSPKHRRIAHEAHETTAHKESLWESKSPGRETHNDLTRSPAPVLDDTPASEGGFENGPATSASPPARNKSISNSILEEAKAREFLRDEGFTRRIDAEIRELLRDEVASTRRSIATQQHHHSVLGAKAAAIRPSTAPPWQPKGQ